MPKIDKSLYTKAEFRKLKAERRLEKQKKANQSLAVPANPTTTLPIVKDNKIGFVLGNGKSRQNINLNVLQQIGTVYGCNAIYRDFLPDYLVAVDTKMILELNSNGVQHKVPVWTNQNKAYFQMTGFNFFNPSKGWSSGPTALWMASEHGYSEIYILGFDYQGLGENFELVNNVYASTNNYKKDHERATYFGNWLKQTTVTIQKNPQIKYIRVLAERPFVPKELTNLHNLAHITLDEFKKKFVV